MAFAVERSYYASVKRTEAEVLAIAATKASIRAESEAREGPRRRRRSRTFRGRSPNNRPRRGENAPQQIIRPVWRPCSRSLPRHSSSSMSSRSGPSSSPPRRSASRGRHRERGFPKSRRSRLSIRLSPSPEAARWEAGDSRSRTIRQAPTDVDTSGRPATSETTRETPCEPGGQSREPAGLAPDRDAHLDLDGPDRKIVTARNLPLDYSANLGRDGRWLVRSDQDGFEVWDLDRPDAPPVKLIKPPTIAITKVMSPDGKRLAAFTPATFNTTEPAERRRDLDLGPLASRGAPHALKGAEKGISVVEFGPDGRWLAMGHGEGQLLAWDMEHPDRPPAERKGSPGMMPLSPSSGRRG